MRNLERGVYVCIYMIQQCVLGLHDRVPNPKMRFQVGSNEFQTLILTHFQDVS